MRSCLHSIGQLVAPPAQVLSATSAVNIFTCRRGNNDHYSAADSSVNAQSSATRLLLMVFASRLQIQFPASDIHLLRAHHSIVQHMIANKTMHYETVTVARGSECVFWSEIVHDVCEESAVGWTCDGWGCDCAPAVLGF